MLCGDLNGKEIHKRGYVCTIADSLCQVVMIGIMMSFCMWDKLIACFAGITIEIIVLKLWYFGPCLFFN